jgi:hypothetical protein
MGPEFLADFLGGKGLPGISSSSSASAVGGTQVTPWNEGDIVISYDQGNARSGDRTAPAATTAADGTVIGASSPGISAGAVMAAIAIVGLGLAWRLLSK